MSITLKTNTAIRMVVGPFIDKVDGFTLKTGMTVTNLAMNLWQEHDDGSAPTKIIDGVHFTASGGSNDMIELSDGFYEIELTAEQLNFIGRAKFQIYDIDVILPYFESWQVVSTVDYESAIVGPGGISLLTITECRALVRTSLTDANLQALINLIEGQIESRIGAYQDDTGAVTITETLVGEGAHLFLKVAFSSIVSITEDSALLDADEYQEWPGEGMVEKLPEGCGFEGVCVVVYKPADQRNERKTATINLVRLYVERTAMTSEGIAGEYSFNAPDWDKAIKRELKNLCFQEV